MRTHQDRIADEVLAVEVIEGQPGGDPHGGDEALGVWVTVR